MTRYAIGVDFGTESGRAVLVDVADGRQVATAVHRYANGVIDHRLPLPDRDVRLQPDWALQDPDNDSKIIWQKSKATETVNQSEQIDEMSKYLLLYIADRKERTQWRTLGRQ